MTEPDDKPDAIGAADREANNVETVFIEWDGDRWEIPAKVTLDISRAMAAWGRDQYGDPDVVVALLREVLSPDPDQMRSLNITGSMALDDLVDILNGLLKAAGKAWGTGNFSRSSRQSRGTGRR